MSHISVFVWKTGERDALYEDLKELEKFAKEKECAYCYEWGEVKPEKEGGFTLMKSSDGCFDDTEDSILMFLTDFRLYCMVNHIDDFTFHFKDDEIREKVEKALRENFNLKEIHPMH